jgi:signal transduction histidine kinase
MAVVDWARAVVTPENAPTSGGLSPTELSELRHEVANALAGTAARVELLLRNLPSWAGERDRRTLLDIRQGIARVQRLVSAPRHDPAAACDLREVVAKAISAIPPEREADVRLCVFESGALVGPWDAENITQVLVNLLLNATKYSAPGTPISVEVDRLAQWALIVVRDRGIGIPAEDLQAVFRGHRTAIAQRMAPGNGIGLPLCRRLIEAAGGDLWVTSTPGQGSVFAVRLPLASVEEPSETTGSRGQPGARSRAGLFVWVKEA